MHFSKYAMQKKIQKLLKSRYNGCFLIEISSQKSHKIEILIFICTVQCILRIRFFAYVTHILYIFFTFALCIFLVYVLHILCILYCAYTSCILHIHYVVCILRVCHMYSRVCQALIMMKNRYVCFIVFSVFVFCFVFFLKNCLTIPPIFWQNIFATHFWNVNSN